MVDEINLEYRKPLTICQDVAEQAKVNAANYHCMFITKDCGCVKKIKLRSDGSLVQIASYTRAGFKYASVVRIRGQFKKKENKQQTNVCRMFVCDVHVFACWISHEINTHVLLILHMCIIILKEMTRVRTNVSRGLFVSRV